ncbi:MAG: nitronate monooxygenase [Chitinophagales bacterium]|nr:nitronate monooxygenase [Chitinophagales bacterium]
MQNRITQLFKIQYPIIQAGMIWCSGWELASAVSNAGGLGIIGAGSMYPEVLKQHIQKCKVATSRPFAVNLPLLYPSIEEHIKTIIEEQVPIVFTSAGNPNTWTSHLKAHGITVVHVVSSRKFALKSEEAGVHAIVAEGFEAGGHNGREETTTLCLIPEVCKHVKLPVIAAGGIGSGKAMLACFALGAEAIQIGSRFVVCEESSAHANYKNALLQAKEGDTEIRLKSVTPVRLLKNKFYEQIKTAEERGASPEELRAILGKGRAKKGMFEGELIDGELEIGQVAAQFENIMPAADIIQEIWLEFLREKERLSKL